MANFPVEAGDNQSIVEGLNYVLSGPSGLGQFFAGFSSYSPAYLTGNYRTPFSQPVSDGVRNLYVAPISVDTIQFVDTRTIEIVFASTQPSPPFQNGNPISISGSSESWYDGGYNSIGIVSCTTTSCYVRLGGTYNPADYPIGYGGTIELNVVDSDNSTDCNARVIVTGITDRVFISGQVDQTVSYDVLSLDAGNAELSVYIAVNRYKGFLNDDPVNPDYLFNFDGTVAEKQYTFPLTATGPGTLPLIETVFSTLLDTPVPAYYWYILELRYESPVGSVTPTNVVMGLRSLSSQVVKQ